MINHEESLPSEPQEQLYLDPIDDLLQEVLPRKNEIEPNRSKEQLEVSFRRADEVYQDKEEQRREFRLLQVDDSNYLVPERPFPVGGQEPPLDSSPAKSSQFVKKDSKLDRLAYEKETRGDKIERYKSKKVRRVWDRKISYDCRKVVADNRARVNGRFAKKSPLPPATDSKTPQVPCAFDLLNHPGPHLEEFSL